MYLKILQQIAIKFYKTLKIGHILKIYLRKGQISVTLNRISLNYLKQKMNSKNKSQIKSNLNILHAI